VKLHLVSSIEEARDPLLPVWQSLTARLVMVVTTARLGEGRPFTLQDAQGFAAKGIAVDACDIRDHDRKNLLYRVRKADACILLGGNAFVLMHALIATGFAADLVDRAAKNPFTIIGESAGALVFGTRIDHAASMDDPAAAPQIINRGLGWLEKPVLPHRGCLHWGYGAAVEEIIAKGGGPEQFLVIQEDGMASFDLDAHLLQGATDGARHG